jgi:hypothetical protein
MEGKGNNPIPFEKKSSVFGVCHIDSWPVGLPISQATKGAKMQCCFL